MNCCIKAYSINVGLTAANRRSQSMMLFFDALYSRAHVFRLIPDVRIFKISMIRLSGVFSPAIAVK
jgi:hypothetical protein